MLTEIQVKKGASFAGVHVTLTVDYAQIGCSHQEAIGALDPFQRCREDECYDAE